MPQPRISFYLLPQDHATISASGPLEGGDALIARTVQNSPALIWTWLTYLRVRQAGVECRLTDRFPQEGIVVSAACSVPLMLPTPARVCHVSAVADSPARFYPQVQVFQNTRQLGHYSRSFFLPALFHIPHWAQPGLIPRDSRRGDSFVNVGFVGSRKQMAAELASEECTRRLADMGLRWSSVHKDFNDYSEMDCLIGIRSFDGRSYDHKPASKLVNAWLAGVPAVLGPESAYREAGRPGENYLEVGSVEELFAALAALKADPALRSRLVAAGRERVNDYTDEAITKKWVELLTVHAPVVHAKWCGKGPVYKTAYHADQYLRRMGRSLRKRIMRE